MEPFREAVPACARCGALRPDTFAPNGDRVCRGCAGTMEANARIKVGVGTTKVGVAMGITLGISLLSAGGLLAFSGGMSKASARIVGLLIGLGIVCIAAAIGNLKRLPK